MYLQNPALPSFVLSPDQCVNVNALTAKCTLAQLGRNNSEPRGARDLGLQRGCDEDALRTQSSLKSKATVTEAPAIG
jgi:hypothetical protein